jgi:hypothetical protein
MAWILDGNVFHGPPFRDSFSPASFSYRRHAQACIVAIPVGNTHANHSTTVIAFPLSYDPIY